MFIKRVLQLLDLADPANTIDRLTIADCDAGGIVAAILEPAQALHQYRDDISFGNCADDSTHLRALHGCSCRSGFTAGERDFEIVAAFAAGKIA